jgi:glycine/D-amino acid oxidase-like deaminating enzyme
MISYWEKEHLLAYDFIVAGGGIVGLSTAVSIKESLPKASVLVLERGLLPTGASTKNAGFACIGSLTEILDDLVSMSATDVVRLVQLRFEGLRKLRDRLGDKNIGYTQNGSYELLFENDENIESKILDVNELFNNVTNANAFEVCKLDRAKFGFSSSVQLMIENKCEGELNTGLMMRSLIDFALQKGIEIKTGCEILSIEDNGKNVSITVKQSTFGDLTFNASKVAVCTNAFTQKLYPDLDVKPGRGLMLVTKPISNIKFKGIYHFDKGYYYFRNINNRILFGGGRNLDFETESTTSFEVNEKIKIDLLDKLQNLIAPDNETELDMWWTGIMAFGRSKYPILQKYSENVAVGVRMGGMGVAIGTEIGEQLSSLLVKEF